MKVQRLIFIAVFIAATLGASNAFALNINSCSISDITVSSIPYSAQSCLPDDASEQSFLFTLSSTATLNLFTTSWAQGGFAPALTLFDGGGTQLDADHGGDLGFGTCGARTVANTDFNGNACLDAFIQITLGAGSYRLVLTESGAPGNLATGNFAGAGPNDQSPNYQWYGNPSFTGVQWYGEGSQLQFLSPNDSYPLTNAWAVSIQSQTQSEAPEPVSFVMAMAGLVATGIAVRRRRANPTEI